MAVACVPEKSPGVLLSLSNLAELASDLHPARVKWFLIGGHLKIKNGDLEAIRLERSDLNLRLHEVLKIWLTRMGPACVEDLIGALMKPNVNEQQLALALQEKYNCEVLAPCLELLPVATIQDKIVVHHAHLTVPQAREFSKQLRDHFKSLVSLMRRELEKKFTNENVSEFIMEFVVDIPVSRNVQSNIKLFPEATELSKITTFNALFIFLSQYWDLPQSQSAALHCVCLWVWK